MTAYEEGRLARRNGLPISANPYGDTSTGRSWSEGWKDSDTILRSLGLA
jgi:hypothetical protein